MTENDNSRAERLDEVKLRFIRAWEEGQGPDVETYARQHPEFAEELIRFGLRFALAFTGPEPEEDECDDYDAADAMQQVLDGSEISAPESHSASITETFSQRIPHLQNLLNEKGTRVDQFATAIKLPSGLAYMLVQGVLDAPPPKLVDRVARFCDLEPTLALAMLNQGPPPTSGAYLLRSETGAQPTHSRMTFAEALGKCRTSGELTNEQAADWSEEVGN